VSRDSTIEGRELGAYRLGRRLGAGGIGAVYAATHVRTGRAYAVKVLLPASVAKPKRSPRSATRASSPYTTSTSPTTASRTS